MLAVMQGNKQSVLRAPIIRHVIVCMADIERLLTLLQSNLVVLTNVWEPLVFMAASWQSHNQVSMLCHNIDKRASATVLHVAALYPVVLAFLLQTMVCRILQAHSQALPGQLHLQSQHCQYAFVISSAQ